MTDTNVVIITGRLTRDIEVKKTQTGFTVGRFSVANKYRKKDGDSWKEESNFFDVVVIGRSAESLEPYLKKGRPVCINGEMRQQKWEQDGQTRTKIEVIANGIQLFSSSEQTNKPQTEAPRARTSAPQTRSQTSRPAMPPVPPKPQSSDGLNGPECWEDELCF